jgi:hypothetical protein
MALANQPGFTALVESQPGYSSHHTRERLINELFDQLLKRIADLDLFNKNTAPAIFLVYAHKSTVAEANVQVAQQLIEWLKTIRVRLQSDRSPLGTGVYLGYSLDGDDRAAHNILWNQFCLLPKGAYDKSVDKVILCCSDALGQYNKTMMETDLKCYPQEIKEAYSRSRTESTQPTIMHGEINQIISAKKTAKTMTSFQSS